MFTNKFGKAYINQYIRADQVRCIDQENKNIGIISISQAMQMAQDVGLDLVQFSGGKVPTVKILNFNKFRYEQSKLDKAQAKKARESMVKIKEIKFSPRTDLHDLQTKAKMAAKFLENGCKVKITVKFKGREIAHPEMGENTIQTFVSLVQDSTYESPPELNGKIMTCMLTKRQAA